MKIGELLITVGRPVAYYPRLAIAVGGNHPGILLCQLLYWYEKGNDEDGWIWKNSDEIEAETGLSYEEQKTARKQLRSTGILEEKYDRLNHRMGFRIDLDRLETVWEETLEKHPDWSRHLHAKRASQQEPCTSVKTSEPEFKNSTVEKLNCGEPEFKNSTSTSTSSTSLSPQKVQSAVKRNQPSPLSQGPESNNNGSKTRYSAPTGIDAEALYRKIRPTHVTIPSSINPLQAIEVLKRYLQLYQDLDAAANALRPFAQEADRRGIRETNLCWLTEWAAVGKIPPTTKNTGRYKREMSRPLDQNQPLLEDDRYDQTKWPWEWKRYDSIMKYGEATIPEEQIRHMSGDDVILFMHQTLAKKLPEGLQEGQTLRICFDDENIFEGELEEIIYSTLHPEYITHLVVDGEAIDALELVEAKEIRHVP